MEVRHLPNVVEHSSTASNGMILPPTVMSLVMVGNGGSMSFLKEACAAEQLPVRNAGKANL